MLSKIIFHSLHYRADVRVQWAALKPHSEKVVGPTLVTPLEPFWVEFACSVCLRGFFGFLPQAKDMHERRNRNFVRRVVSECKWLFVFELPCTAMKQRFCPRLHTSFSPLAGGKGSGKWMDHV